ncbi:protein S100-A1-like isoform X2 [Pantherophis guttatus]|uniref:Protein S100-A1-like isoform X2 n=1 Tax=Pantherophis guttatus TaxID=94885 RepID=A0ABM3ZPI8_PANGU|nr:protein S100-A1-like isoform X2 [Pantherophis guttatus]
MNCRKSRIPWIRCRERWRRDGGWQQYFSDIRRQAAWEIRICPTLQHRVLQAESGRRGGKEHLWERSPRKSCQLLYISGPRMPSELERAMEIIINIFHQYATRKGDKDKLSKKELKQLLQKELGLETQKYPEGVDKIMCDVDENGDGKVSFQEFLKLVVNLIIERNSSFSEET